MAVKSSQKCVALLGSGTQGRRLAYMWSSRGRPVHLIDAQDKQLRDGEKYIQELRSTASNQPTQWGEVKTFNSDSLHEALQDSWLIVECVPEKLELKRKMIAQLDESAPDEAIIASNSSSYSISEIIDGLNLSNESRVLSTHSYWPPETSALEIMGHQKTNPDYIDVLMQESRDHGFSPFHVKKDSMGYIYNRIWAAIKREALLAASEGVATPSEIDAIFKDVLKTPKGPFEQMDVVGLDVVLNIEENYADKRQNLPSEPREYLQKFIERNELGVKSGQGFYKY